MILKFYLFLFFFLFSIKHFIFLYDLVLFELRRFLLILHCFEKTIDWVVGSVHIKIKSWLYLFDLYYWTLLLLAVGDIPMSIKFHMSYISPIVFLRFYFFNSGFKEVFISFLDKSLQYFSSYQKSGRFFINS